jgi:hypothetical protein
MPASVETLTKSQLRLPARAPASRFAVGLSAVA